MSSAVNVGAIEVRLDLLTADFNKSQIEVKNALAKLHQSSEQSAGAFGSAWAQASARAKMAYDYIIAGVLKVIQANVDLARSAESLGASVESLGRWQGAARSAGVSAEEFQRSVKTLYARMSERGATDEGVRTFAALGIAVRDSQGRLKDLDSLIPALSAKFSTMRDGVEKTRIATSLFGEKGAELLPFLNKGPAALDAMASRARELGLVLSKDSAEASIKFTQSLNKMNGTFDAVIAATTNRMIPTLQSFADRLNGMAEQSKGAQIATETLVTAFKIVGTGAELLYTRIEQIGIVFSAVGRAALAVAKGEFSESASIMKSIAGDYSAAHDKMTSRIKALWSETPVVVGKAAAEVQKKAAPVVATAEEISKELERIKTWNKLLFNEMASDKKTTFAEKFEAMEAALKSGRVSLEDFIVANRTLREEMGREDLGRVLDADTVPIMDKMRALEEAKAKGIITWGEYSNSMKMVSDQGAKNMDDLLSATSGALTTLFKKSKTAAIASALINTYQGITKAIASYPPPLSYAMAGIQAALGFAQVAAIRSQSESGGGSGASSGTAAAQSAPQAPAAAATQSTLTVQGINAKGLFTGDVVRSLADQLLQFQRDGGRVILT